MQADPKCCYCHGTGMVYDWVDYESTRVSMPSQCDCAIAKCNCCGSSDTEYVYTHADSVTETWYCNLCGSSFEVAPTKIEENANDSSQLSNSH